MKCFSVAICSHFEHTFSQIKKTEQKRKENPWSVRDVNLKLGQTQEKITRTVDSFKITQLCMTVAMRMKKKFLEAT